MVVVPSGSFLIGSKNGKERERPVKKVTISRPFAIGRFELTFDEWDACYKEKGCSNRPRDRNWGRGKRPVINILFSDIFEYLMWISRITKRVYRLPSESEWEYSARAGTISEYWWGNKMMPNQANCRKCGSEWSGIKTAPVGSFKPNPWGLYDVHGNVFEYVSDCWINSHSKTEPDGSPYLDQNCRSRVLKSGAWYYLPSVSRSASRVRNDTRIFSYFIGFRVLREIKQ